MTEAFREIRGNLDECSSGAILFGFLILIRSSSNPAKCRLYIGENPTANDIQSLYLEANASSYNQFHIIGEFSNDILKECTNPDIRIISRSYPFQYLFDTASGNLKVTTDILQVQQSETQPLILIGASAGGVRAINELLPTFSPKGAMTIIAIHMPYDFSVSLAQTLSDRFNLPVLIAEENASLLPDHIYIAPGGHQTRILKDKERKFLYFSIDKDKKSIFSPSIDILFFSVSEITNPPPLAGVILSGMERDGVKGIKDLHKKGAVTFAQSEESCIVFGIPKAAIKTGVIENILDPMEIGNSLVNWIKDTKMGNPNG